MELNKGIASLCVRKQTIFTNPILTILTSCADTEAADSLAEASKKWQIYFKVFLFVFFNHVELQVHHFVQIACLGDCA